MKSYESGVLGFMLVFFDLLGTQVATGERLPLGGTLAAAPAAGGAK